MSKSAKTNLSVIIPAAGMGRRMKSYGAKALIELPGGWTVISRQLHLVRQAFPRAEVVVAAGFDAERLVKRLPGWVKVVENEGHEGSNVARSLALAVRVISEERALIVYGDLVFNAAALEGLHGPTSAVLVDTRGRIRDDEVGLTVVGTRAAHFDFGLAARWGQMAYLAPRELRLLRWFLADPARKNHFGYEVLNAVIDAGGRFRAVEPEGMELVEIDTSRDIAAARSVR